MMKLSLEHCWHWQKKNFYFGRFWFSSHFFSSSFYFIALIIMELSMLLCEREEHNGNGWRQRWRKTSFVYWACAMDGLRTSNESHVRHWFIYHSEIRRSFMFECVRMESWKSFDVSVGVEPERMQKEHFHHLSVLRMLSLDSVDLRETHVKALFILSFFLVTIGSKKLCKQ